MDFNNAEDQWAPLNNTPMDVARNGFLGKRRAWNTLDRREWWFLGIVSVTLAVVLGLTLYRLSQLPGTSNEITLGILLLLNIGFCYIYAYHGVLYEQANELYFLVLSTGIIMFYTVLGYKLGNLRDSVKTGMFLTTLFIGPTIAYLGYVLRKDYRLSGDLLFSIVGGDPFMQSLCRQAQLHCVLLLFDAQAIVSN